MRKIKAVIYTILGLVMCTYTFRQGNYFLTAGIALFVGGAVYLALASLGQKVVSWDESGITVSRFRKDPVRIRWSEIKKLKVDHLGYHVIGEYGQFHLGKENMPANLLSRIRKALRERKN
ncbi:hypothetical protein [Coraliomargarita parva]|uniref:hypothetical protein n=1 Tax=Coraliomargarita parva TaxID=3014050 RepID=UPI0022B47D2D|nr:hypothetical protein [Coraliomargarita parva]